MGKNEVGEVSSQSTLVSVHVVIECTQGRAYQRMHRLCHRHCLMHARMKHWVLVSASADGAILHLRRHCLVVAAASMMEGVIIRGQA